MKRRKKNLKSFQTSKKEEAKSLLGALFSRLRMFRKETLDIIIISEGEINPPGENNRSRIKKNEKTIRLESE